MWLRLSLIINRPIRLPEVLQIIYCCLLKSEVCFDFWKYLLSKTNLGFWASSFFQIVFRLICSSVSVNTGRNPITLKYRLIFITVSNNFFGFVTTVTTRFRKIFEIFFLHFIAFLFSFYFVTLVASPNGFEILRNWTLDNETSQLLHVEI